MGRRKKNFEKKYDFDDFCVSVDIYNKQVVFFTLSFFAIKEDATLQDLTEARKEVLKALKATYKGIKAERRLFDIWMGEVSKGKCSSIKLFGAFYIKNKDEISIIENEILEKSTILMEKIKEILNKYAFNKFTKPKRYERDLEACKGI